MNPTAFDVIRRTGLVPVVTIDDPASAVDLAEALAAGGVRCLEITMRTPAAAEAIQAVARDCPDVVVGAGTVLDVDQAGRATDAGSRFIVSPGFDPAVARWSSEHSMPLIPGVYTASEVMAARGAGLDLLKLFPAGRDGVDRLSAFASVFPDVSFVPTGGIDRVTVAEYAALPNVAACGGSWIAPSSLLSTGDFEAIRARAEDAVERVRAARSDRRSA